MAAGMFVAAAKGNGNASFQERGSAAAPRKRPELGHLVQRPTVTVTSDSTEAMRAAPGWIHKEWTDEDLDLVSAGQPAAKRRIGGITLLATWQLKDDAKVDPHCVICRFQIRIARTSRLPAGEQAVWKEAQPFFCVSAEEVQKQYMAFLSDFLQYGEEYIVSVRAGSVDNWSEWSPTSEPLRLKARDLEPPDFARFCCDVLAPRESGILEIFRTRDHALHFAFPAFKSFDPRTPLPVEYCIEAWQRPDDVGAAAAEQLQALSRLSDGKGKMPGSGPDWEQSSPIFVTSVKSDLVQGNPVECSVDIRSTALVQRSQVFFSVRARYLSLPGETNFSPKLLWSGAPVFIPELVPVLAAPVALPSADCVPASRAAPQGGMGTAVVQWPFRHPANFCGTDESGDWIKGPYVPNSSLDDFPLPFRLQFRCVDSAPVRRNESVGLRWSEWREVEAYEFVRRHQPNRHGSQRAALRLTSQAQFDVDGGRRQGEVEAEVCLDPAQDPLGVLVSDDWAVLVSGLDIAEESSGAGLTQLRWVSCSVEGSVSAPSRALCIHVAPPCTPVSVQHVVVNCSSSSHRGLVDMPEDIAGQMQDEWVVHEIRHVARLSWQMDWRAPSFGFISRFLVRYKEVPPGKNADAMPWQELAIVPMQEASDETDIGKLLAGENYMANFMYDVTSLPLLRFHRYLFAVQVRSDEQCSPWSPPSKPLHLMLPEVVPPPLEQVSTSEGSDQEMSQDESVDQRTDADEEKEERSAEAEPTKATQKKPEEEEEAKQAEARDSAEGGEEEDGQAAEEQGGEEREAEEGESQEDKERQQKATAEDEDSAGQEAEASESREARERQQKAPVEDGDSAGQETASHVPREAARRKRRRRRTKAGKLKLIDAEVLCSSKESREWYIQLRWRPFPLQGDGAQAFPALLTLPSEFQVSYFVLSERPCAEAQEEAADFLPPFVRGFTANADGLLAEQHAESVVCLEGSMSPGEEVVFRRLPRSRLPPLRCDVRLFVVTRSMAITGPQWSRQALCVDLSLPRQVQLPLPVPQHLSCWDLRRRGLQMDLRNDKDAALDTCWAAVCLPKFARDLALAEGVEAEDAEDLLNLTPATGPASHYVLQYRSFDPDAPCSSSSARPLEEECDWREVPAIRRLDMAADVEDGAERIFLAAGLDPQVVRRGAEAAQGHAWAKFRLASRRMSHFSYASIAAPVSPLTAPAKPGLAVRWVDSPSLDGLQIQVSADCDGLSQGFQLRFRLSDTKPEEESSWTEGPLVPLETSEGAVIHALAPTHQLSYHSEYCFSLRSCSVSRFSPWSEESDPFRVSLEQFGMCQDDGLQISFLGQGERHNCRCSVADVSWAPLAFPAFAWSADSVSPSPPMTIEYRLRWRRRLDAYNDAAAMFASMNELRDVYSAQDDWKGARKESDEEARLVGINPVRLMMPDPDQGLQDVALRGYHGDYTKRLFGRPEHTPWQTAAIVSAKVAGPMAVSRCAYALTFLEPDADYEVAVDWRWRRFGDSFWMPALEKKFKAPPRPASPDRPEPLRILPEVMDAHDGLQALIARGARGYGLFRWPFANPPCSEQSKLPPPDAQLTPELRADPGHHSSFAVQCRARPSGGWKTCQVHFLEIAGKPTCFVETAEAIAEDQHVGDAADEPKPTTLPQIPSLEDDEVEFRILRLGDCQVSEAVFYPAPLIEAPTAVKSRLKMLGPHSELALSISFRGLPTLGVASAPQEYQVLIQEMQGQRIVKDRILPPSRLPLQRIAEAFGGARQRPDFLGARAQALQAERSGGEAVETLEPLEFEHLLTLRDLIYGKNYRVAIRWLSQWKVSAWSEATDATILFPAPTYDEEAELALQSLESFDLMPLLAGEEFQAPALWHRVELAWDPFQASLWGGGQLEYRLERRSLLHDRRRDTGGEILPPRDEEDLEVSKWELLGTVVAAIEDGSGKGAKQLTNRPGGGPVETTGRSNVEEELPRRTLAKKVLEMTYLSHADSCDPSFARRRVAKAVCREIFARICGTGEGAVQEKDVDLPVDPRDSTLMFHAEELLPSVTYQFRLRARLAFHPASEHEGEWSKPLTSKWYRPEEEVVPNPAPPREAVAPDPPPEELFEDGSVVLTFDHLPIRQDERPLGCSPPPAPFQLQFRSAQASSTADWLPVECLPLHGDEQQILVSDARLKQHTEDGVVFRLWRAGLPSCSSHAVKEDARVRHFSGLTSMPSKAMAIACPTFDLLPRATLVFCESSDLHKEGEVAEDPPLAAMLRLEWKVHVPQNSLLDEVQRHQVRFRRVHPPPAVDDWQEMAPFLQFVHAEHSSQIVRDIPLASPHFLFGAKYETCVRIGTALRWGEWSSPEGVSLAMHPPQPAASSELALEEQRLEDGATFFRLTWPAFDAHPLCNLVEYRIRMQRMSRFKYQSRLSPEMAARAQESLAAQEKLYVVGTIRRRLPQKCGPALSFRQYYQENDRETLEFVHSLPGDPECAYRFFVDAKHERFCEVDGAPEGTAEEHFAKFPMEQEEWSAALASRESLVPPAPTNWLVPEQVPFDADPDPKCVRSTYPLALTASVLERLDGANPAAHHLCLFAPWKISEEAARWPYRVEYAPYLPSMNGGRLPVPGDVSEDRIDWYAPDSVEYVYETAGSQPGPGGRGPSRAAVAIATGFDHALWDSAIEQLGLHQEQTKALGLFARVRFVREGGPEGMQFVSSPSRPLRLLMPPLECPPSVTVWSSNGRFVPLLWWPSIPAKCAETDKNLDMSGQMHQVRMRRPAYQHDRGWVESQVKRTLPPVTVRRSQDGAPAPHAFDLCHFLDDAAVAEENQSWNLPHQPLGASRAKEVMTYEFSVRVSDGYRWSDWSAPSRRCCFAIEPKIVKNAPVSLEELQRILISDPLVVASAEQVDLFEPLSDQIAFSSDGDMEPPQWVSVSRPPLQQDFDVIAATARMGQFVASWPNFSPHAYSQPDAGELDVLEQILETRSLPQFVPPRLLYRLNVWLVGPAPDSPELEHQGRILSHEDDVKAGDQEPADLLYRQFDLPPSAFPDGNPTVTTMKWCLPALLPDKIFRCSVEARFETNTSVHWWTPLMMSEEFVVERMPPAAPPELAPVAELPTPQLMKLLARRAPGSTTYLVVRWPWSVQGRPVDILRDACHALEFCPSGARQSLKDSSAKPLDPKGETVVLGRATGPWKEPKAQQVCFANFEKGEVWFELPEDATVEPNWVPLLVASGLWTSSDHASEPHSVHLRWRLKAGPSDVAVTSAALHYSAATGPVRTFVGCPSASSLHLAVPQRISRLAGSLRWTAWEGAVKHQFCYRLLSHQKKRKRGAGLQTLKSTVSEDSESSDYTEDGWLSSSPLPQASHLQAVTGWLELPPISDDVKRLRQMPEAVGSEAELLGEPEEASCLAEFTRRLSPMEWQRLAWRHYHQRQEEFFDPAERDRDGESTMELTSQFQTSMSVRSTPSQAAADLADARQSMMSTGNSSSKSRADKKDVPFRLRSTHSVEWRVRVSDGIRWSDWSAPSEPAGMVPPIPTLSGPVRLFFNRREPTILRVVWSGCEPLQGYEHLMDSIEYLLYLSIDEESGSQFIQEEGNFDVQKLHRRGVYLSDGSSGCLLPFEEEGKETPKFDFESLFSDKSQKRLLGKFRQKEIRTVRADSADGDEQSATVTGFDLMVSGLKPHCLHRISVCVRCAVEGLPEPDWQRLKLDPTHPLRWSDPVHSSPLLTPQRRPPLLVPELVPIPEARFGRFLHTPCILLKCAMFAKTNKNDADKDHSVVIDCRPAGGTDEDYRVVPLENSVFCQPAEHGPCRLVYNLPFLRAEIRTRNVVMNDVSAASIPFFAVPPLTVQQAKGPSIQIVEGKDGNLFVRAEWTSRCLPDQQPVSVQIGIRRHALDQSLAEQPSQAVTAAMRLEELPTSRLALSQAFEPLMVDAETRYRNQGGVIRDESPFYCKHCFQPIQRQADSKEGAEELGPFAQSWLDSVQEVLEDSAVAAHEIAAWSGSHDPTMLRAPHAVEVEKRLREKAEPWEDIRKAKPPCSCRDVFCRKDLPVDGETLVIGTVYTFRLRVYDGFRWSPWTEHCPAVQVLRPLLKDSLPATPTAGLAGEDSQLEGRNGLDGRFQTEMGLEVEARFGSLLFKGQGAIPAGSPEKVVLEAGAVSFVDEHRNLPKATPLLTNPGGDPWPIGAEPKKFIMRTKARTVYADRLPDSVSRDNDIDLSLPPSFPEDRPHNDDFREDSLDRKWR